MKPTIYKRDDSAYWWAAFRVGDRVQRVSTGCTDETAASVRLGSLVREAELQSVGVDVNQAAKCPNKFIDAWKAWIRTLENFGREGQARSARGMVKSMGFANKATRDVSLDDIADYIAESKATRAPGTVFVRASTLRSFYEFASFEYGIRNLAPRIPKVRCTTTRRRVALTHADAIKLFGHDTRGKLWAFITFGGLRKSEAKAATASWIRGNRLCIPAEAAAKSHVAREVVYPDGFLDTWAGLPKDAKIVDFDLDPRTLRRDLESVGVNPEGLDIHGLRRSVATWLAGYSLKAAQEQLGHSSQTTTKIYVKPNEAHGVLDTLAKEAFA